jgi:hypothetical protein
MNDPQPRLRIGEIVYLNPGSYEDYEHGQWVLYRDSSGAIGKRYRDWADKLAARIAKDPHLVVGEYDEDGRGQEVLQSMETGERFGYHCATRKPWDPQTELCLKQSRKKS